MQNRLQCLLSANYSELDEEEQKQVYEAFYGWVYGTIYLIVKDHQATEDIIQEAFLKVVLKKPAFKSEASMWAWLRTVSRNMAITYLRKYKKYMQNLEQPSAIGELAVSSWKDGSVEDSVEMKLMEEAIVSYLRRLKPEYRILVEYRWRLGLSYREIADKLGVCENIVRQRLFRTREGIKKKLYREWERSRHT